MVQKWGPPKLSFHTQHSFHMPHTSCNMHVFYTSYIHHSSPTTYMYSTVMCTPYHMLSICHMASYMSTQHVCTSHTTHTSHIFNHTHSLNMYYTLHGLPLQTTHITNTLPCMHFLRTKYTSHTLLSHRTRHIHHTNTASSHTHTPHMTHYCCWLLGSVSPLEAKWCHGGLRASCGKCGFKGVGMRDRAHSHLLRGTPWSAHAEEFPPPLAAMRTPGMSLSWSFPKGLLKHRKPGQTIRSEHKVRDPWLWPSLPPASAAPAPNLAPPVGSPQLSRRGRPLHQAEGPGAGAPLLQVRARRSPGEHRGSGHTHTPKHPFWVFTPKKILCLKKT